MVPTLFEVAKVLLSEGDSAKVPERLLQVVLSATGAARGLIVVREGDSFEQRFAVRFDRDSNDADRKFSRSLVRRAIESKKVATASLDAEPKGIERSFRASGAAVAWATPLVEDQEVHGVVYIDFVAPDFNGEASAPIHKADIQPFLEELAKLAGGHLKRALVADALLRRNRELERDLFKRYDLRGIVTHDPGMVRLLETVAHVADSDATVLITGETGTGKELIARALHENSKRKGKPYVALHTSALPTAILESELFGHVKGAFTGADRDRTGRIASAHGGTLFLDEVAEIAPEIQVKLLRVLQFGEIQRAGSDRVEKVDVRLVAATHQPLGQLVEMGKFRRDLYYRLKVIEVEIPPLRRRKGDILLLANHFARTFWTRAGEPSFSADAARALENYTYPGNVRELMHAVQRACVLSREPHLTASLLPPEIAASNVEQVTAGESTHTPRFPDLTAVSLESARLEAVAQTEQAFLHALMEKHESNVSQAARESGLNRTYLQKLLARYRKG